ncbi:MAG: ABC transporter permease [Lentilactobacillus diolivorans]|nr:ABC transporter permease [Lentilactobacillus diolivorans]RRG04426.1 MAG: ABC transporter permease [Lactobacillus sp.]
MHSTFKEFIYLEIRTNEMKTSLIVIACSTFIPFLFSMIPNSMFQAALPGELLMPLLAIFCFGNLLLPEQRSDIVAVINSKLIQLPWIYMIRFAWYSCLLSLINGLIIIAYHFSPFDLDLLTLWFDFTVKSLLIGSIVILGYSLSRSLAVAYLIPTVYFALCLGYPKLGWMDLLTIMHNQNTDSNWFQCAVILLCLIVGWLLLKKRSNN